MNKEMVIKKFAEWFPFVNVEVVKLASILSTCECEMEELQKHCHMTIPGAYDEVSILRDIWNSTDDAFTDWSFPCIYECLLMNHRIGRKNPEITDMVEYRKRMPLNLSRFVERGLIDCADPASVILKLRAEHVALHSEYGITTSDLKYIPQTNHK